jgi:rubrerythrin
MPDLKGSQTEANLRRAFAREAEDTRRHLYFAQQADVEGLADAATTFRATVAADTGHALGHLEFLAASGDPATGLPIGDTVQNLRAAIAGGLHEAATMYPEMARVARAEGFDAIADWFESLAAAERSHADRFARALDDLGA